MVGLLESEDRNCQIKFLNQLLALKMSNHISLPCVCMHTHKQMPFPEADSGLMLLTSLYFAQFLKTRRISDTNSWADW